MRMEYLLIPFLLYWIRFSGASQCSLTATFSRRQGYQRKLQLQLQCGTSMCPMFDCFGVRQQLGITCTGGNCMKMETYSVCNSPEDSCAAPERLSPRNSTSLCTYSDVKTSVIRPSPTFARSECIPVTTTAYKNLSQLSECTMITATTTVTTERSPNPQHKEVSQTKAVDTDTITKTLSATPPILCSCSKSVNSLQLRMNESLSTANQTLPSALGALLGIAVVALVVTTMGWVWTCWRLKKSGGIKINSDEQERTIQNPMYTEVSQTQQSSNGNKHHTTRVPTYATVSNKSSKRRTDGNTHNQVNITTSVSSNSQTHHYQQEPEDVENNYSLLGKEDSDNYNITGRSAETNDDYADPDEEGKGWGQESPENVYHVLEGPAMTMEEGEGPTQDEATVYEVPVPTKPLRNN